MLPQPLHPAIVHFPIVLAFLPRRPRARSRFPRLRGRAAAPAGSVATLLLVVQTGHSGGQLVYTHGAAQAYVGAAAGQVPGGESSGAAREDDEGDEDRGRSRTRGP